MQSSDLLQLHKAMCVTVRAFVRVRACVCVCVVRSVVISGLQTFLKLLNCFNPFFQAKEAAEQRQQL